MLSLIMGWHENANVCW